MAMHTFDRGGSDDNGTLTVSLFTYYGEEYVWSDIEPGVSFFGLTSEQARAYAADLIAHADALDERNIHPAAASQPRRLTVVVTPHLQRFKLWCREQNRNPYDSTIIRIADGQRDVHKLQGIHGDFDLVVLNEIPHHNEAMAMISHRMATAPRKDSSQ